MSKLIALTLLLVLATVTTVTAQQCMQLTNVAGATSSITKDDLIGPQGPPGARGLPGSKGAQGPAGSLPTTCKDKLDELLKRVAVLENSMSYTEAPLRTCADHYHPGMKSGEYLITPVAGERPMKVHCEVGGNKVCNRVDPHSRIECGWPGISQQTCESRGCCFDNKIRGVKWCFKPTVLTQITHNSEAKIRAKDCEPKKCSVRDVKYNLDMKHIRGVIAASAHCRQFIKFECRGVVNNWGSGNYWAWSGFDGKDHTNWGTTKPRHCACGVAGNCINKKQKCNCDNNDTGRLATDEGYLTDKANLPVTAMKFGDMGSSSEKGWHTLGKLECY